MPAWHIAPSEPLPELATLVIRNGLNDVLGSGATEIHRDRGAARRT